MSYGVDNIKKLLKLLGNPHEKLNSVLITGSGGKGSVTYLVSYVLEKHGYKVGSFTKPHLHRYTERISINSEEISKERVLELANYIYDKIKNSDYHPTFFEFTTALSMLYFLEENVDICVYEVGIGGRYDATNVLNPCVSAITAVYLEHTKILGNTVEEIAWNKVGIARPDAYLVYGYSGENATNVVRNECEKLDCLLITVSNKKGFDVFYENIKSDLEENVFNYYGLDVELKDLKLSLLGEHQQRNASIALAVLEILDMLGYDMNENKIREVLINVKHKGRLEIFKHNNKIIILDCAKDPFAIKTLSDFLKKNIKEKFNVVISISNDKDYINMLNNIKDITKHFVFAEHKVMSRAISNEILANCLKNLGLSISFDLIKDVKEALRFSIENLEGPILVTGSVFTVAEARELLVDEEVDEIGVSDTLEIKQ